MSYRIKNYPYLVKIIFVDAYGMAFVSNNYNGSVFRIDRQKLIEP